MKAASRLSVIMDEASGNYFGKRLLRAYYYERMPKGIAQNLKVNLTWKQIS
jgi:hypothetical protein